MKLTSLRKKKKKRETANNLFSLVCVHLFFACKGSPGLN